MRPMKRLAGALLVGGAVVVAGVLVFEALDIGGLAGPLWRGSLPRASSIASTSTGPARRTHTRGP